MARDKIAPTLTAWFGPGDDRDPPHTVEMRRELLALKAVARAVDAYDRRPAGNEDEDALRYAAMVRALARLQRKEPKREAEKGAK